MCASSYRVVGWLSVRIKVIETVGSNHINHAASVCQHILLLSKTHTHTHKYTPNGTVVGVTKD